MIERGWQYICTRLERISQPPQEENEAAEVHESLKVCDSFLPSRHESPKAHEPREEAFDLPAMAIAVEPSRVLGGRALSPRAVGGNELDTELELQLGVERVAVVGLVADQDFRDFFGESSVEGVDDELAFMSLTARNPGGERKAMAVCHCHDLGRFAASSDPNIKTPLFAPA